MNKTILSETTIREQNGADIIFYCRGLEYEKQELYYFNKYIQNGPKVKKFTGFYSSYQYKNLQKRLEIDKLILVNLHLKYEQVFPHAVYVKY